MANVSKSQQLTKEAIKLLEATHRRIAIGQGAAYFGEDEDVEEGALGWQVAFRPPTQSEITLFKKMSGDDLQKHDAEKELAKWTVVHVSGAPVDMPPKAAFEALLTDYPLAADACATSIGKLVGMDLVKRGKA